VPDGADNTWILSIGTDGLARTVAWLDAHGAWHDSVASLSSSAVTSIAAGLDSHGSIQVLALDAQRLPLPLASLAAGAGQWSSPGAWQGIVSRPAAGLWLIPGPADNLMAIASGQNDGQPFVAGSFGDAGAVVTAH
jgi:hypothetical protein